jgi:hypothetical protein
MNLAVGDVAQDGVIIGFKAFGNFIFNYTLPVVTAIGIDLRIYIILFSKRIINYIRSFRLKLFIN